MFGINGGELIVLFVVAAIVIGPGRLPEFAEQLAKFVKSARQFVTKIREEVVVETEQSGLDLADLDPRKYDPRRIVKDALSDLVEPESTATATPESNASQPPRPSSVRLTAGQHAPWDNEAT